VANYNVDIEIALKGSQKLKDFNKAIKQATRDVTKLNKATLQQAKENDKAFKARDIANVQNYSKAVNKAAAAVRRAAVNTEAEKAAINNLVRARKQHNAELERQNRIIRDQERAQGLTNLANKRIGPSGGVSFRSNLASPIMGARDIKGSPLATQFGYQARSGSGGGAAGGGGFLQSKLGQNLALGGGFPLLFGGGAGSIAGGLLGSAGGFGGQILGSALGQQLDQFAQKTTDLSRALEGAGDVTQALEVFIGRLNSETSRRIKNLQESGQTAKAADAAFKELSQTIGVDNARALVQAGQDFETLGNKTAQFFAIVGAQVAGLFQEAFYLNTTNPLSGVPDATPELLLSRSQASESLQISQLQTAALRAQGTGSLEEAAEADKNIIRQERLNDLKEFDRQVTEGLKDETKDIAEREKIIEDAKRAILQIDLQLLDATKQRAKETERLAEQARREQEAARKRFEQEQKQRRSQYDSAVVSNATQSNALMQLQQQLTALEEGESAALQKRLNDLSDIAANEQTILDIRYQASRGNAKSVEEENQLYAAYYRQVQALNTRVAIERRSIAEAQSRIQLEKELLSLQQQQTLAGMQTGIGRQIEDANLRPTGSMSQDQQIELRIGQIRRQKDAELELTNAIAAQKIIRDSLTTPEDVEKTNNEISRLESRLALTQQLLPQLSAAEQAQLRFNQALQAAQPFADAFTSSLFNGLMGVVDGTQTAQEAFAGFLNSIADMLMQTAQQMIAQYLALAVARTFAMGGGPVSSGINTSSMSGGFNPLSFVLGPFSGFGKALGGSVSGNQPYLVGERGPELFVPGAQGNIVPNNAMGGVNVGTINISVENTGEQLSPQAQKQLAGQVKGIVLGTLANERRSGGML